MVAIFLHVLLARLSYNRSCGTDLEANLPQIAERPANCRHCSGWFNLSGLSSCDDEVGDGCLDVEVCLHCLTANRRSHIYNHEDQYISITNRVLVYIEVLPKAQMFARTVLSSCRRCTRQGTKASRALKNAPRRRYSDASPSSAAATDVQSPIAALGSLTSELDKLSPRFDIDASQYQILQSPTEFFETLKVNMSTFVYGTLEISM